MENNSFNKLFIILKQKSIMKYIFALTIVLLLLSACTTDIDNKEMTSTECAEQGGNIVNSLGGKTCAENEESLGEVTGMKCQCICCKPI